MYIQLAFFYGNNVVPESTGGIVAALLAPPKIINKLPEGATANQYSARLKLLLKKEVGPAGYIHDCGKLTKEQIERALESYNAHYQHKYGEEALATYIGLEPSNNELIVNLQIALDNVLRKPEEQKPFTLKEGNISKNELFYTNCY